MIRGAWCSTGRVMKLEDELALEYMHCRATGGVGDRIGYWHWAHKTHPALYSRLVAKIKETDEDVERVRMGLLKEGW